MNLKPPEIGAGEVIGGAVAIEDQAKIGGTPLTGEPPQIDGVIKIDEKAGAKSKAKDYKEP
jgi:UDP-3-O-[3-hydroxymyristoyl] glucosamine N-acyltransferase